MYFKRYRFQFVIHEAMLICLTRIILQSRMITLPFQLFISMRSSLIYGLGMESFGQRNSQLELLLELDVQLATGRRINSYQNLLNMGYFCDPNTQEIRDLAFQMGRLCFGVFVYWESLHSIDDKNKRGHPDEAEKYAKHV